MRTRTFLALAALAAALVVGCDGGSTGTVGLLDTAHVDFRPPSLTGVAPTPVPPPDGARLLVTVSRVDAEVVVDDAVSGGVPADDHAMPPASPSATPPASEGWVTLSDLPTTIDLFDASSTGVLLAGLSVPSGRITQIRLVLASPTAYVAPDGTTSDVTCPSCTETGIKVATRGTLVVPAGGALQLTLDFTATYDASRSFLDPVIVVARS